MTDTSGNTLAYSYGTDGLRTEKTYTPVNGTEYYERYYYSESALCYIVYTGGVMSFLYDANGGLLSTNVNGTNYIYLKNAQGDIIGLADRYGNVVVEYTYDAWGNILSITGSLAGTLGQDNPFRYRSYCYDDETGLYSLQSRFYDPEVGRFINADDTDVLGVEQGSLLQDNLFAYCLNNPVNRFDDNGNFSLPNWAKVTIGAVAIVGLAVATVATGGAAAVICGAALSGAIAGGASGAALGAIGGGISGGWQGALDGACSGFMTGTLIGGVTGAASAGFNIATGTTSVVGNAHGSVLHKLSTNMQAGKMAASGQYSQIGLNKSLKTMSLNGTSRPDVIGIGKNGINKLVEVISPKQSAVYISSKMGNMLANNSGSIGKIVNWVGNIGKLF